MVRTFSEYWPIGRLKYRNWRTPVASLANTIEIQVDKVLRNRSNGSPPSSDEDAMKREAAELERSQA